jgi:Mannosyltransferase (PIG-V)
VFRAKLVSFLLIYKAFVIGLALFYAGFLPGSFSVDDHRDNFHLREQPGFAERFSTWDGEHYLNLSENGYRAGSRSAAFYPLWPGLIHVAARVMRGHSLIAALLLANVFSLSAWILFHHLVSTAHGEETANSALALLLAYPGSLFYQFPYSESLFLLLAVLFFIGLSRDNYCIVAATGFLLPLTRATGIFCLLPLAWHLWEKADDRKARTGWNRIRRALISLMKSRTVLTCVAPLAGYASYFAIMWRLTGNAFEGFDAQHHYLNHPSIANILNVSGFIGAFFHSGWHHGFTDSPIDRAFFVVFLVCLPLTWKSDKRYFFYGVGSGLVPAMSNWFFSYTRLLTLNFPMFIVFGAKLASSKNRSLFWFVIAVLAAVQTTFIVRHVNFRWVG